MTTFHRLTTYVLAGMLLASGLLLIAAVFLLPGPYSVTAADGEQFSFSPLSVSDRLFTCAGGLALALGGVLTLALETLGPPSRQQLPLAGFPQAGVTIARQSVVEALVATLERLPGVIEATPRLRCRRDAVAVDVTLRTDPDVPTASLCEQARAAIASTLSETLGLTVGPLRLRVRHAHAAALDVGAVPAFGATRD